MIDYLDRLKGGNILVTGGAGFIGSNLVDVLAPDNNVVVLDDLSSGTLANLEKSQDKINFIKGDVRDEKLVVGLVAKADFVFHLAANVGNVKSIEDPLFDMDVNIRGTINLLEACRRSKIERLVYSASSAIFGESRYLPMDEEHPIQPESPYAVSKLSAEKYCFTFHKVYGVPVSAVRYFNVYGPRQGSSGYSNVIPIFFRKIREENPLTIFGDGKQTRDFVFVGDVVQANILAATTVAAIGEGFNIGTGNAHDLNELVTFINQITGKRNRTTFAPARKGEVRYSQANITKAQKILGYKPFNSLEKGLSLTWETEAIKRKR